MKRQLVITTYKNKILSCLYEDDRLAEVMTETARDEIRVGDIYIGKVMKIVSNIDAAFVAIAPGVNGYYSLKENSRHLHTRKADGEKLACGDEIMVQVSRENLKTKAWTLSSDISLAGDFVVLDAGHDQIRISAKITEDAKRDHLRQLVTGIVPDDFDMGLTIRTAAQEADAGALSAEIFRLHETYEELISVYRNRTCYSRLFSADPDHIKLMRRYLRDSSFNITTDIRPVYENIMDIFVRTGMQGEADRQVKYYNDPSWPLIKLKNIEAQLEKALAKKVWMRSGAYLVIEQTEAMTVIDVNTGKNLSKKEIEKHFLDVNLEAAQEICRQIRLRNLSGIIIVDFINMKDPENGQQLMQVLRTEAARDPVRFTVVDRTRLQLVEMTRQKIRRSLAQQLAL